MDIQITVHNRDLVLLMDRSKHIAENIEKLSGIIPVLKDLEEADK